MTNDLNHHIHDAWIRRSCNAEIDIAINNNGKYDRLEIAENSWLYVVRAPRQHDNQRTILRIANEPAAARIDTVLPGPGFTPEPIVFLVCHWEGQTSDRPNVELEIQDMGALHKRPRKGLMRFEHPGVAALREEAQQAAWDAED